MNEHANVFRSDRRGKTSTSSPDDVEIVGELFARIRELPWRTGSDVLMRGEALAIIRELQLYDEFVERIGAELGLSIRKAENCIAAHQEFSNVAAASSLSARLLLQLSEAKTPKLVRDEVKKRWRDGQMLQASKIETWVISGRADAAQVEKKKKDRLKGRRKRAWNPRTIKDREKREREKERRLLVAYGILHNLQREEKTSVGDFLWKADQRDCQALATKLNGYQRYMPATRL